MNQTSRGLISDCNDPAEPKGPGIDFIKDFVQKEEAWLDRFVKAWQIATSNGHFELDFSCAPETDSVGWGDKSAVFVKVKLIASAAAMFLMTQL